MPYIRTLFEEIYSSAEMKSIYSTAPADLGTFGLIEIFREIKKKR